MRSLKSLPDLQSLEAALERLDDPTLKNSPFFMAVGFHKPHTPFKIPREFYEAFKNTTFDIDSGNLEYPKVAYEPCMDVRHREDWLHFNLGC